MSNGLPVSHDTNSEAWETARRYFTILRNGQFDEEIRSIRTCDAESRRFLRIRKYVEAQGYENLRDFPQQRSNELLAAAAKAFGTRVQSRGAILNYFKLIRNLHYFYLPSPGGRLLNDGFTFDAFTDEMEVKALARKAGKPHGRTKDVPPEVAFKFINASIEFIALYASDIIALRRLEAREREKLEAELERSDEACSIANTVIQICDDCHRPTFETVRSLRLEVGRRMGIDEAAMKTVWHNNLFARALRLLSDPDGKGAVYRKSIADAAAGKPKQLSHAKRILAERVGLPFTGSPGMAAPWPIEACSYNRWTKNSIHSAVIDLWISCWFILACFMADRISETLAITVNCLVRGLDGYYLDVPNFKTHNADSGTTIRQPCPPILAMAVQVLLELGADARARTGSDKLLFIGDTKSEWVSNPDTAIKRIDAFGRRTGASTYDNGKKVWSLRQHELRRFFPTAWVNYNEYGEGFPALMTFLDQNALGTIVRYASSRRQGESLTDLRRDLADRIISAEAFEGLDASGPLAEELNDLFNRMRIRVIPADQGEEWLKRRGERLKIEAHPLPWGYCFWSIKSGAYARCVEKPIRRPGLPRPEGRKSECVCGDGCRNFLTTDLFAPFWESSHARHDRIRRNPAAPDNMKTAAEKGVKIARKFRSS